jgi:hypothetical protein
VGVGGLVVGFGVGTGVFAGAGVGPSVALPNFTALPPEAALSATTVAPPVTVPFSSSALAAVPAANATNSSKTPRGNAEAITTPIDLELNGMRLFTEDDLFSIRTIHYKGILARLVQTCPRTHEMKPNSLHMSAVDPRSRGSTYCRAGYWSSRFLVLRLASLVEALDAVTRPSETTEIPIDTSS